MKPILRGILAIVIVSAILLISDLQNRDSAKGFAKFTSKGMLKLCMVYYNENPNSEDCEKGLRQALQDKNLKEGVDFSLKIFNAQGDISTLNSIAGSINNEEWDLIFTTSTPTIQLLVKKLPDRKMVFTNVGDPVAAGLGNSFEDHLPNITGISTMSDFEGLIKLVKALHPGVKRVGTVFTPAEVNSVAYKNRLAEAAIKHGIELVLAPASTVTEVFEAAQSLAAQQIEVFCQISDNLTSSCSSTIMKISLDYKIPYYGFVTQQIKQGAVAVCARDYVQAGYEAALMGFEVLEGKNPAQIPYQFVKKTDYLINMEAARNQNVQVPEQVFKSFPTLKISKPE